MQVHVNGPSERIRWFSRQGIEHGAKSSYNILNDLVWTRVRSSKCILDGELLVWNNKRRDSAFSPCALNPHNITP